MSSRFEFHTSSTLRPSFAERNAVLQEIESLQESEDQVDASINLEEAHIASLTRESNRLTREIERRKAHLSPIRKVPFEVLGHIFELYLEEGSTKIAHLQLVSRAWRITANNHPSLWTRINVVGPFYYSKVNPYKRYINSCVKRSGNLPLHVLFKSNMTIEAKCATTSGTVEASTGILEYLCIVTNSRWVSFSYIAHCNNFSDARNSKFLHSIMFQSPRLQHLRVEGLISVADQYRLTSDLIRTNWSHLRSLDIGVVGAYPLLIDTPLPQVHELTITNNFWASWRTKAGGHWLYFFPRVRNLTMTNGCGIWPPYDSPPQDTYEAMHVSNLTIVGPIPWWSFDGVSFPALKRINIVAHSGYSDHVMDEKYAVEKVTSTDPVQLTLTCSDCCQFWALYVEVTPADRLYNQHFIRETLTRAPLIESVEASSCIWNQFYSAFDEQDEEIEEAARRACPHKTKISMPKLEEFMSRKSAATDARSGGDLYWRLVYGDYKGS